VTRIRGSCNREARGRLDLTSRWIAIPRRKPADRYPFLLLARVACYP
jgi:hypothetical protein